MSTRIPMPEASRRSPASASGRRKRHVAGNSDPTPRASAPISDIKDSNIASKPVLKLVSNSNAATGDSSNQSDMDSSLGILSPSEMKSSGLMTASQASSTQGWANMTRSRTFTREDPKEDHDLVVEDIETHHHHRRAATNVKRFKLNTNQIEAVDDDTTLLMSRTEELLHSAKTYDTKKMSMTSTCRSRQSAAAVMAAVDDQDYPDVADTLKFRTESLLHSKSSRRKKKKKESVIQEVQVAGQQTDSSGSSWSNIPRCFNVTTSMLSSDAGISSMPSSMISNVSESDQRSPHQSHFAIDVSLSNFSIVVASSMSKESLFC